MLIIFLFLFNLMKVVFTCAILYSTGLLPQTLVLPDYMTSSVLVCVYSCDRVDICVRVCQLLFSWPVTLHLVIQQPHMRDFTPSAGVTQPPYDKDSADLLELSRMWFHFEAANMACIKHKTVNWMSGFTSRCMW